MEDQLRTEREVILALREIFCKDVAKIEICGDTDCINNLTSEAQS